MSKPGVKFKLFPGDAVVSTCPLKVQGFDDWDALPEGTLGYVQYPPCPTTDFYWVEWDGSSFGEPVVAGFFAPDDLGYILMEWRE